MTARFLPPVFAFLVVAAASTAGAAQDPPEEVKRLEAWPELHEKERVTQDVLRLRKANTEEMAEQARDALIADGAMVAPLLISAYEKERDEDARERVLEVLERVVGAPHTRLLAEHFTSKELHLRVWALRSAAAHPDRELRDAATKAWKAVQKKKDKADPEESYAAAVCLTSTGDLTGMPVVFARARSRWQDCKDELRNVMRALRGTEVETFLLGQLHDGERKEQSAALRLLASCGTERGLRELPQYLESTDATLRADAINACRGIVDDDPPLDKLPVFESIGLAKEWLERIR